MKENDQAVDILRLGWAYHWFLFPTGLLILGALFSMAPLTERKESEDSVSRAHCYGPMAMTQNLLGRASVGKWDLHSLEMMYLILVPQCNLIPTKEMIFF